MKKIIILCSAIILLSIGCNQEESNPIEGAWNLVYAVSVSSDTISWEFQAGVKGFDKKMWSKEHFIFGGEYLMNDTLFENFGGGTYSLDGNIYNETIEYHVSKDWIGKTIKMFIEVTNDTLYQRWPLNDAGEVDKSNFTEERYTRLR